MPPGVLFTVIYDWSICDSLKILFFFLSFFRADKSIFDLCTYKKNIHLQEKMH